jgi:hypothetical protein
LPIVENEPVRYQAAACGGHGTGPGRTELWRSARHRARLVPVRIHNLNDAEILNCSPFTVEKIKVEAKQCGNTWFLGKNQKTDPTP